MTDDREIGQEGEGAPSPADDAAAAPSRPDKVDVPAGVESTLPEDVPRIQLPIFEGPLDLLLYLIRRERIDIHDIPIAPITRRYMEYLDLMKELNLELAGEFLVMAATLIHIKSKMLVPLAPAEAEGEEPYEDPREELVQRLLEFQRYKEAAGLLHQKREIRAATWIRPDGAVPSFGDADDENLEVGLFDLIGAFKELLDRRKVLLAHEVRPSGKSIEERMGEIFTLLREGESIEFLDLFEHERTKSDMIVTFLALLELIRLRRIKVYQRGLFGPIRIFRPIGPETIAPPAGA
ncbi:MAG: segregation/condensation protein A [Vicinamibacteria bacterium]|nr:segregation/condensation protein A [Vicinamibacteria bacterium]